MIHHCLLHYAGIGDWIACESFYDDELRENLEILYWCSKSQKALQPAIAACREFKHVKHLTLQEVDDHHSAAWRDYHPDASDNPTTKYQNVLDRMPFTGSSFLRNHLADIPKTLPKEYAVLHLSTPYNPPGQRRFRDMEPSEWPAVLSRLDDLDLPAVIINSEQEENVPNDHRLVDMSGRTCLKESIEIVKHAKAFIGIDSWASILACQCLTADKLHIRSRSSDLLVNPYKWYSPHETFPFLVKEMGGEPYPHRLRRPKDDDHTLVALLRGCLIGTRWCMRGDVVELPNERANVLCNDGVAKPYRWSVHLNPPQKPAPNP